MRIDIEDLTKELMFEVKLQIELYKLAEKVMSDERRDEFTRYMEERKDKLRKLLGIEHGQIYERNELIFEI